MIKLFLFCTAMLGTFHCAQTQEQTAQVYPPDISFCIVDLKYKKPHLKICEFGEGVVSGFYGYQRLYGQGRIWTAFWNYLEKFQSPIFYVDPQHQTYAAGAERSLCTLRAINGNMYKSVTDMKDDSRFKQALQKKQCPILTSCRQHRIFHDYKAITETYPNAILLDNATRPFVLNKFLTHLFFMNDPALEHYRPGCKILPTQYSPTMASEIIKDIPSPRYVIKPINAYHGKGIIFTEQHNLDRTLKTILNLSPGSTRTASAVHQYWQNNPKPYFLVETCESSQPINVYGKLFDATMRVAFGISYNKGAIDITVFGAYWKLPKKPIDAKASLADRYQSYILPGTTCSAKVDPKTLAEVEKILRNMLPKVYIKMIAARHNPELLAKLMAEIEGLALN